MRRKQGEQSRLVDNLVTTNKTMNKSGTVNDREMERVVDESEKLERLMKTTNRSYTSQSHSQVSTRKTTSVGLADEAYFTDDSIPGEVFGIITKYRGKLSSE